MKRSKSGLSLILALLIASAALTGCASDNGGTAVDSNAVTETETTAPETTNADPYADELGEYNFDGAEFHAASFTHVSTHGELTAKEETGDLLNDAIYRRNRGLEDRFNFVFTETGMDNKTDDARTAVLAGDDAYDIITTRCTSAFDYAAEGIVTPFDALPNIDLDKAYWDQSMTESLSILGSHYFAMGDYNLSSYDYIHTMLFNKKVASSYNIGDLYDIVRSGEWTYDKFTEVTKPVIKDINGDGAMTVADSYGYLSSYKQVAPNFWISAGELSIEQDKDGKPVFSMAGDENFYDVFTRIFEITWDEGNWLYLPTTNDMPNDFIEMFRADRALFIDCTFFRVNSMRDMDTDFGIIPYPKYTEAQDEYYSRLEYCALTCVPVTNKTLEMTGVILEALSCESAKTVIPAYYDLSLRTKLTRDEESSEMLDIIFASRVFDWGDTIFSPQIRDGAIKEMFGANNRDLASKIASLENTVNSKIETTVEMFEKLN